VASGLSDEQLSKIHHMTTIAAMIGAILKTIDLFVIRGVSVAGAVLNNRNQMDTVGSNPVSIVCAVFLPACLLVPFTWQILRQRGIATKTQGIATHVLFIVPILASAAITGARSQIVIYALTYTLYAVYLGRVRIRAKIVFQLFVGMIVLLAITTAIFNNRLEAMHMSSLDSVYSSAYAFTLQPQEWVTHVMQSYRGIVSNTAFAILLASQYYLHGVFEFVYQIQNAPPNHIWGAASFNSYYKFAAYMMHWPTPDDLWNSVTVHRGIYTTFFGPVYSDFGWLGPIYMTGLGVLAQRTWENCRRGEIGAVPLYMYLIYVMFLFPVQNGIANNMGLYTLSAFGLFFLLVPRGSDRTYGFSSGVS
jgi:hypothetical protein